MLATLVGVIAANSDVDLSPAIRIDAIFLATLFSTAVGLLIGLYPAKRAAGLEPREARRRSRIQGGVTSKGRVELNLVQD